MKFDRQNRARWSILRSSNSEPRMSLVDQLHALPRRSIAVCFTPVSGIDSRSQALPGRAKSGYSVGLPAHCEVGREIHLIDYYEASGQALSHYVQVLEKRGYFYDRHYLPHDAQARESRHWQNQAGSAGKARTAARPARGDRDRTQPAGRGKRQRGAHDPATLLVRCRQMSQGRRGAETVQDRVGRGKTRVPAQGPARLDITCS